MGRLDIDIKSLLDMDRWEELEAALSKAFRLSVMVFDYKGNLISSHTEAPDFCGSIRTDKQAKKHCYKSTALAGLEAVRRNTPYIYRCGCGVINAVVPIMIDERYLGFIHLGQMRAGGSDTATAEQLREHLSNLISPGNRLDFTVLRQKYNDIPEFTFEQIQLVSNLFQAIVHYISERAVKSRSEAQTYEWVLRYAVPPILGSQGPDIAEFYPSEESAGRQTVTSVSGESPVYPAINYVETHRKTMVGMHEMADLCHLSPSYFSKLFLREVGQNFTDWVNKRKVEWAKEMLRDTGLSITGIASELGYMDTSYFIKVFKKFEGTTPLVYRQHKI